MNSKAEFSPDRTHRYSLSRIWDASKPLVTFCMLNPSTADETVNDPTIERCQRRAQNAGYGGIIVVNIFSFRSTDPKKLKEFKSLQEITPLTNDYYILQAAKISQDFVCGWGKHGSYLNRDAEVLALLREERISPMALKTNKDGSPAHPLSIGYDVKPFYLKMKHK